MFKNILIPISSEHYSKNVLKTGIFLAEKFHSNVTLVYIIEEKTINKTKKIIDSYRTPLEIEETKKTIILKHKQTADNIIFNDAKFLIKNKNISFVEKTTQGEFSDAVKKELGKKQYDLILMGFEKGCLLNYRILEDVDIPVWIETKGYNKKILGVCSNLAPNQKVPKISIKLSKALNWDLQMLYVIDTEDSVQVDEKGMRSGKKLRRDLEFGGQKFADEMKTKNIQTLTVRGSLENETIKAAKKFDAGLIVVGRQQKKKGKLGLPVKNIKRKIVEKCKYSILFTN